MNIEVVSGHFNVMGHFEQLANDLEAAGHITSATEIRRGLSGRLVDLDAVLNRHKVAIAVTLEKDDRPAAPHWLSLIEQGDA
ncbi:hypothetical protein [Vreelandella sp. TE19]